MLKIFWGTGKVGKSVLALWKQLEIKPDYFCDNNEIMWGKELDGIPVVAPKDIFAERDIRVYITCYRYDEIIQQLLARGIAREAIVVADSVIASEMIRDLQNVIFKKAKIRTEKGKEKFEAVIDLSGGMVLGGVERWSYSIGQIFCESNIRSAYVIPSSKMKGDFETNLPVISCEERENAYIVNCVTSILQSDAKVVVCNFPFSFMQAACIVKKYLRKSIKIIAIIHNDEEIYYRTYSQWRDCIDVCFVISSKIENKILDAGFPSDKIKKLAWQIPIKKTLQRTYSKPNTCINIGYAGRVTIAQKRLDRLIPLAKKLKTYKIKFCIWVAGSGDFYEQLEKDIISNGMSDYIRLLGFVEHDDIYSFWERQDVCISLSDWEGHSITQSEAMASGAVPVVTNTSGTEDDIQDGVNGYIIQKGDFAKMAERILELYQDREKLVKMGEKARQKIKDNNEKSQIQTMFWKSVVNV